MCGILLVKSRDQIPVEQHLDAFVKLQSRGPDFCRYDYKNNIFIGQAVLHITGSADYYHTVHKNFLAYNGEIYNYQQLGNYNNDIEFVDYAVENDLELLAQGWGPWAWAWNDGTTVRYASDPQGERCLYQYHDDNILIVCSEVAPILDYVGTA
jgi:asparagine synthetase B (glutamine-hydrolysing)